MKPLSLLSFGTVASAASLWLSSAVALAQPRIEMTTNPSLDEVVPFKQTVQVSLNAEDAQGQPLKNAQFLIQVNTPPKTPWLTTDFPVVEGTTLLELPLKTTTGQVNFELMPPIRGQYQVAVTVSPQQPGEFTPFTQTLNLQVPENPDKFYNLAMLLGILLLTGGAGGWIIGGNQTVEDGEIAPQPVRMLLSGATLVAIAALLYIAITAEMADAHGDHGGGGSLKVFKPSAQSQSLSVTLQDRAIARVGQTTPMEVSVMQTGTQTPVTDVVLDVEARMLEYDKPVLRFQTTPDASGHVAWKQQFFDGAGHEVAVKVSSQPNSSLSFAPIDLNKEIDVEGVAPPLLVRFISLGYFTGVFAAGLGIGFWARRRFSPQPE